MQSLIPRYFKILQELLLFFGCFLVFAWLELRLFTSNLVGLFSTLPTAGSGGSWTGANLLYILTLILATQKQS